MGLAGDQEAIDVREHAYRDLLQFEQLACIAADAMFARRSDPVIANRHGPGLTELVSSLPWDEPQDLPDVCQTLLHLLREDAVRSDHPRYFGLFNPPSLPASVAGDLIAAAINPQLAVHSHAPAAALVERRIIDHFGHSIWGQETTPGTFTSGGSEANMTGLICALSRALPSWSTEGLSGTGQARPVIYASSESHLAWIKIARACGMGSDAVRLVRPSDGLNLDADELRAQIERDTDSLPIFIAATAGATAHGAIDKIEPLAQVAKEVGAWLHVDAAWAGGLLLDPKNAELFPGIGHADSVTIDPHKWLAVPMGAGMFLTKSWEPLHQAFNVSTSYMPSASTEVRDAYIHSMQWSRRFIGAKVFTAILRHGIKGYAAMFRRQMTLGRRLRKGLIEAGWRVVNDTPLPLVCFDVPQSAPINVDEVEQRLTSGGEFWISKVAVRGSTVLRACVTSFETDENDVDALIAALNGVLIATPVQAASR